MSATTKLRHLLRALRTKGVRGTAAALHHRAFPARLAMQPLVLAAIESRRGLEIGGPSRTFGARGISPLYPFAAAIDNVNFAGDTVWEAALRDGGPFVFHRSRAPGRQFIREAGALTHIADAAYDFVASSHCLEHVANPLATLREWLRVTRPGGHLILILPDPVRSFDHRRPITTLAHLREDAAAGRPETDSTHFAEVLALHDVSRDSGIGSIDELRVRVSANAKNRCVHHHVFDLTLMQAALRDAGWDVRAVESAPPVHLVALARRPSP